jgi:hypothetical protein
MSPYRGVEDRHFRRIRRFTNRWSSWQIIMLEILLCSIGVAENPYAYK